MLFTHFSGHMAMIKWRIYGLPDPQSFGPKLAGQFPPTIIWCDLTGRHCVCVRSGSQNGLPLQCISSFRCNVLGTCYFIEVDTCDDIVTECSTVQFWRRVWLKEKNKSNTLMRIMIDFYVTYYQRMYTEFIYVYMSLRAWVILSCACVSVELCWSDVSCLVSSETATSAAGRT